MKIYDWSQDMVDHHGNHILVRQLGDLELAWLLISDGEDWVEVSLNEGQLTHLIDLLETAKWRLALREGAE